MVTQQPYLPDIFEGIVNRVNQTFSTRDEDPFTVRFAKGILGQVSRDLYRMPGAWTNEVVVWLVMNYVTTRGTDPSIWGSVVATVLIVAPTDNKFSQDERDAQVYGPRLLPVEDVLLQEIRRERWFQISGIPLHNEIIRPYWGGGALNGPDQPNLWQQNVDCIALDSLRLRVKLENCFAPSYMIIPGSTYPQAPNILVFEPDMDLIVGSGAGQPVDGENSVAIPGLKGKAFEVAQRGYGELREEFSIEVTPLEDGGFQLLQGLIFKAGDTYTVKVRPYIAQDITGLTGTLTKNVSQVFIGSNS